MVAALCALTLAGCSTLTIEADLSQQVAGDWHSNIRGEDVTHLPKARVAVEFQPELTRTLSARLGIEHLSYPSTGADRGEERAVIGVQWRPFARQP